MLLVAVTLLSLGDIPTTHVCVSEHEDDSTLESCFGWCSVTQATDHCQWCKVRPFQPCCSPITWADTIFTRFTCPRSAVAAHGACRCSRTCRMVRAPHWLQLPLLPLTCAPPQSTETSPTAIAKLFAVPQRAGLTVKCASARRAAFAHPRAHQTLRMTLPTRSASHGAQLTTTRIIALVASARRVVFVKWALRARPPWSTI